MATSVGLSRRETAGPQQAGASIIPIDDVRINRREGAARPPGEVSMAPNISEVMYLIKTIGGLTCMVLLSIVLSIFLMCS